MGIERPFSLDIGMNIMHTNGMKIAVSIPEDVIKEIENLAREQNKSRSRVITEAAREYIRKSETRRLIARLNKAYSESDTPEEESRRRAMAAYQRKRLRGKRP